MANPQLTVEIGANISQLTQRISQAVGQVGNFSVVAGRNLDGLDRGFTQLSRTATASSTTVSRSLAQIAAVSATSGRAVSAGSNQAAFALTNLGRVAQDAPFGFIGIQNNLNPLLESFQRLKAETGSTGSALKALGSSLIGPAGLGVALSLVTAGITFYTMYQQKANKATENAKKTTEDYISTLDQLDQARLKGAQDSTKEVAKLQSLYSIYQNANVPLNKRKEAYKELQDQYPAYFQNIAFEEKASNKTKKAYDQLTVSIIESGRARAAVDLIAKNETRRLENEQKIIDLQKEQIKNQKVLTTSKTLSNSQPLSGGATGGVSTNLSDLSRVETAQKKINDNIQARKNLVKDINLLDEKNLKLTEAITDSIIKGGTLGDVGGSATKKGYTPLFDKRQLADLQDLGNVFAKFGDTDLAVKFKAIGSDIDLTLSKLTGSLGFTNDEISNLVTKYGYSLEEILKLSEDFNKDFSELATNGINSSINNLATSIGESLASGGDVFAAIGDSLLQSFGSFLGQFGKLLVEYGVAAAIKGKLDASLAVPGAGIVTGPLAIAAGVALQIAAAAFSSLGGKSSGKSSGKKSKTDGNSIPGFAMGVTNFRGGVALVGERGPELVNLPKGSDVIPNRQSMGILAGNKASVNINAGVALKGREFVLWFREQESLLNRGR